MSFSWPYLARPAFWMACSIASSTSSRSMFFSRATASATSSSSGRAMAVSMAVLVQCRRSASRAGGWRRWRRSARRSAPGGRDACRRMAARPPGRHRGAGAPRSSSAPSTMPAKRLRPSIGMIGFGAGEMAGEAIPVLRPGQRAVDAGGTDFQVPGAGHRVFHVEQGADGMADRLAVLDGDQASRRRGRP